MKQLYPRILIVMQSKTTFSGQGQKQPPQQLPSSKDLDIYARPVNMTYRGKDKFYSFFGGLVSALVLLLIVAVFFYKLNDVVNFNQTTIKKNTLVTILILTSQVKLIVYGISNKYTPPEDISKKNITIAFMLTDFWGETELNDPTYGKFQLNHFARVYNSKTGEATIVNKILQYINYQWKAQINNNDVPFSKCKLGVNFQYSNYEEIKDYHIENYFCPDWNNQRT